MVSLQWTCIVRGSLPVEFYRLDSGSLGLNCKANESFSGHGTQRGFPPGLSQNEAGTGWGFPQVNVTPTRGPQDNELGTCTVMIM